ncbi:MAG: hypothetical protein LBE03_01550 [Candidatus Nomurabacteria bacterium]|jgi:hypothetical protein|nr:hypothetical protein [Candidatus Nomurabacteria bacterium]
MMDKEMNIGSIESEPMDIENEIKKIQAQNARVERDKAWEISRVRRVMVVVLAFLVIFAYNFTLNYLDKAQISCCPPDAVCVRGCQDLPDGFKIIASSFVPVIGFLLSTLTLNRVRKVWEKSKKRN